MARKKYRPRPLSPEQVGKTRCAIVKGVRGGKIKICVKGGRYAFSGWVQARTGKGTLPLSIGNPRTVTAAIRNARQSWRENVQRMNRKP